MKSALAIVFISIFSLLSAQTNNWAPVGATWHYEQSVFSPPANQHYLKIQSVKDTVIKGIDCKVLVKQIIGATDTSFAGRLYTYEDSGNVFYTSDPKYDFRLWFDFSAEVGDTIVIYSADIADKDSLVYRVDSIDGIIVNGITLKRQHLSFFHQKELIFSNVWIERIGSTEYFSPQSALVDPPEGGDIRCYEDPTTGLYTFTNLSCDYIFTGMEHGLNFKSISSFPNPSSGIFRLYLPINMQNKAQKLQVMNTSGQVVWHQKLPESTRRHRINLSHLPPGVYLLTVKSGQGILGCKKIILK